MTRAAFALCLLISFASAAAGNAKKNQGGNSQPHNSPGLELSHYPKSAVNQVFVPNDGRAGVFHVENCSKAVAWP